MAFKVLFALSALVAVTQAGVAISQANQVLGRGAARLGVSLHGIGLENINHALRNLGGPGEVKIPLDPRFRTSLEEIHGIGGLGRDIDGDLGRGRLGLYGVRRDDHHDDAYPLYAFRYGVKDTHTHDIKNQKEVRDGAVVRGEYNLVEADGSLRRVFYVSDDKNGLDAIVQRGPNIHPY